MAMDAAEAADALATALIREQCPTCGHAIRVSKVGASVFSQALFAKRRASRMSIREAAESARVKLATYYRAEAGRMPDVATAVTLAEWLGMSLDALFRAPARAKRRPQTCPGAGREGEGLG